MDLFTQTLCSSSGLPGDTFGYPGGPGAKGQPGDAGFPGETRLLKTRLLQEPQGFRFLFVKKEPPIQALSFHEPSHRSIKTNPHLGGCLSTGGRTVDGLPGDNGFPGAPGFPGAKGTPGEAGRPGIMGEDEGLKTF